MILRSSLCPSSSGEVWRLCFATRHYPLCLYSASVSNSSLPFTRRPNSIARPALTYTRRTNCLLAPHGHSHPTALLPHRRVLTLHDRHMWHVTRDGVLLCLSISMVILGIYGLCSIRQYPYCILPCWMCTSIGFSLLVKYMPSHFSMTLQLNFVVRATGRRYISIANG